MLKEFVCLSDAVPILHFCLFLLLYINSFQFFRFVAAMKLNFRCRFTLADKPRAGCRSLHNTYKRRCAAHEMMRWLVSQHNFIFDCHQNWSRILFAILLLLLLHCPQCDAVEWNVPQPIICWIIQFFLLLHSILFSSNHPSETCCLYTRTHYVRRKIGVILMQDRIADHKPIDARWRILHWGRKYSRIAYFRRTHRKSKSNFHIIIVSVWPFERFTHAHTSPSIVPAPGFWKPGNFNAVDSAQHGNSNLRIACFYPYRHKQIESKK